MRCHHCLSCRRSLFIRAPIISELLHPGGFQGTPRARKHAHKYYPRKTPQSWQPVAMPKKPDHHCINGYDMSIYEHTKWRTSIQLLACGPYPVLCTLHSESESFWGRVRIFHLVCVKATGSPAGPGHEWTHALKHAYFTSLIGGPLQFHPHIISHPIEGRGLWTGHRRPSEEMRGVSPPTDSTVG